MTDVKKWYKNLSIGEQMAIEKFCKRAEEVIYEDENIKVKIEEIEDGED